MTRNRPPHIYQNNTVYFITGGTVNKTSTFSEKIKKQIVLDTLRIAVDKFYYRLDAWVILKDHYHFLVYVTTGECLPRFINNLHANSARLINKIDSVTGRKVWWNYWDRCIRTDRDYWKRINYIHHNPVKHQYVKNVEEYEFSSFNEYKDKYGISWINDCFKMHPVIDFSVEKDIF